MDRYRVAIVIPALNEAATIASVVNGAYKYGVPVVVDDGSVDSTADVAKHAGAQVVAHGVTKGYDAALNTGFRTALSLNCDVFITLDADGQHDPTLLARFIEMLEGGVDVVVGVRDTQARLAEKIFSQYTKYRYGIFDPLCGMKAYCAAVYVALGHFDSYKSIGTELIIFAARNGYKIGQTSLIVRNRRGRPRFGPSITSNYKIVRAMLIELCCRSSYARGLQGKVGRERV